MKGISDRFHLDNVKSIGYAATNDLITGLGKENIRDETSNPWRGKRVKNYLITGLGKQDNREKNSFNPAWIKDLRV